MEFGVETVSAPEAPAGGLLLDVKACGLCGSDLRTLRSGHRKVQMPYVIGHEICGVVAETGPGYQGPWQQGDLLSMGPVVYCGHCDFCLEGQFELCENYREIAQTWPGGLAEHMAVPPEAIRFGRHRACARRCRSRQRSHRRTDLVLSQRAGARQGGSG